MRYVVILIAAAIAWAQSPQKGSVDRIRVHGVGLVGNLLGDSPTRSVRVYLPPSYNVDRNRRYPVLYMLHGFDDDDEKWFDDPKHWINLPYVFERAIASGRMREMIVVMPDGSNKLHGSMYSTSVTVGDWEDFLRRELVAYIDSRYRTIPRPESRGIAGHSMGGYGALRLGMKYIRTFSTVYALSPCCLAANTTLPQHPGSVAGALRVKTFADVDRADFPTKTALAQAAAWSPNPSTPPFFLDLPWKDGQYQPEIAAKWNANAPLATIDQHIPVIKKLRAIGFDAGDRDLAIVPAVRTLHEVLTQYRIPHEFEIYPGTHTSHVADRIERKMLPFFSRTLSFRY